MPDFNLTPASMQEYDNSDLPIRPELREAVYPLNFDPVTKRLRVDAVIGGGGGIIVEGQNSLIVNYIDGGIFLPGGFSAPYTFQQNVSPMSFYARLIGIGAFVSGAGGGELIISRRTVAPAAFLTWQSIQLWLDNGCNKTFIPSFGEYSFQFVADPVAGATGVTVVLSFHPQT